MKNCQSEITCKMKLCNLDLKEECEENELKIKSVYRCLNSVEYPGIIICMLLTCLNVNGGIPRHAGECNGPNLTH